jgi:hypothetical protein
MVLAAMKTAIWAIALAAVLAAAAVPFSGILAWADDDNSDRRKNNSETIYGKGGSRLPAGSGNSTSLKSFKLNATGLAVEKTEGGLKISDAGINLTGIIVRGSGDQGRATVNGTVDIGGDKFNVRAQGKIELKKGDLGKLNIEGKISKGGTDQAFGGRDLPFQLKALLLPTQDDKVWKVVTEKPVVVGRHIKIYSVLGELHLERSTPAPIPVPNDPSLPPCTGCV